jgi:hypothetical protein
MVAGCAAQVQLFELKRQVPHPESVLLIHQEPREAQAFDFSGSSGVAGESAVDALYGFGVSVDAVSDLERSKSPLREHTLKAFHVPVRWIRVVVECEGFNASIQRYAFAQVTQRYACARPRFGENYLEAHDVWHRADCINNVLNSLWLLRPHTVYDHDVFDRGVGSIQHAQQRHYQSILNFFPQIDDERLCIREVAYDSICLSFCAIVIHQPSHEQDGL